MMLMHEITALELGLAIEELRPKVIGSYLKKFYDLGSESFRFSFHNAQGNFVVYCKLGETLNETSFVEESGVATNFAVAVRKRVEDSKVIDFYQQGGDRIAVLEVQGKGRRCRIFIEMFGKGNLIVADENNVIEIAYKIMSYKDREIKPKLPYVLPKSDAVAIDKMDKEAVEGILAKVSDSGNKTISELSKYLNIGPIYLEDIIVGAGLNPKDKLGKADTGSLRDAILSFIEKIGAPKPAIYMKGGVIEDYSVLPLGKYSGFDAQGCSGINEMLDRISVSGRMAVKDDSVVSNTEEVDAAIAKQKELVLQFEKDSVDYAKYGKKIFERMGEINELIMWMKENRRATIDELQAKFPGLDIKELSLKDRTVTIEVD